MLKETLRNHLEKKFSNGDLNRWFEPLRIECQENDANLVVHFPHKLFQRWFLASYRDCFEQTLREFSADKLKIKYMGDNVPDGLFAPRPDPAVKHKNRGPLSQRFYDFSDFILGQKNFFPVETLRRMASGEIELGKFNPVVLWGCSGCGKTHLLRALANTLITNGSGTVFYCTPEELKSHYDIAKNNRRARQRILAYSVIIIDDLQDIYKMAAMHTELTILIDAMLDAGKQMIFACLDKPGSASGLNPNLRSRLEGGLCLTLKQPDLEVRTGFIQKKCQAGQLDLNKNQILSLASRFEGIRQLEGIIKRLAAYTALSQRGLLDSDFESMLRHAGGKALPEITSSQIISLTAAHLDVSPAEIIGGKRRQKIVVARQIAMYLCRDLLKSSYPELGKIFGGKDHSTIMYSVKKIEENIKVNVDMHKTVQEIKDKCHEVEG